MITVESIRKNSNTSSLLKAYADITIDAIGIKGLVVMGTRDGKLFVKLPQIKGKTSNSWFPVVTINDTSLMQAIEAEILAKYKSR